MASEKIQILKKGSAGRVLVYPAACVLVILISYAIPAIPGWRVLTGFIGKFTFAVPVLFIISSFLSLRISETRVVILSLSYLLISAAPGLLSLLPENVMNIILDPPGNLLHAQGTAETLISSILLLIPFSLSAIFLIPDRLAGKSTVTLKIILILLPLPTVYLFTNIKPLLLDRYRFGNIALPLPGIAASIIPLSVSRIYKNRKFPVFSGALAALLFFSQAPMVQPRGGISVDIYLLFSGIFLMYAIYTVYWENSYIDELTGLLNRRALDEKLRRLRRNYSLSMVDVDHFKSFNDTYGHDEGDNVLRLVAKILKQNFGKTAYRYGGEEFCVIFSGTGTSAAADEMNKARTDIENHMFSIRKKTKNRRKSGRKNARGRVKKVKLTVSAGIAAPVQSTAFAEEVLKNADNALYSAKENGRNRVEISKIRK